MTSKERGTATATRALALAAGGTALALLTSHAGQLHPAIDSFSHIRLQLLSMAAAIALLCLAAGARNVGAILAAVAIGSAAQTAPYLVKPDWPTTDPIAAAVASSYVLLQQNLAYRNESTDVFLRRVADVRPDIITLQEVHRRTEHVLERLKGRYPHQHRCRGPSAVGDVAILSRHPFAPDLLRRCTPGLAIAAVSLDDRALAVGSLHLHWPWPFDQPTHLDNLERHVPTIGEPGILAGDFNAVTWSAAAHRLARMMDGALVRGIGATRVDPDLPRWLRPLWDIPIDNAVVTPFVDMVDARSVPLTGSDHDSVMMRFQLRTPKLEKPDTLVSR